MPKFKVRINPELELTKDQVDALLRRIFLRETESTRPDIQEMQRRISPLAKGEERTMWNIPDPMAKEQIESQALEALQGDVENWAQSRSRARKFIRSSRQPIEHGVSPIVEGERMPLDVAQGQLGKANTAMQEMYPGRWAWGAPPRGTHPVLTGLDIPLKPVKAAPQGEPIPKDIIDEVMAMPAARREVFARLLEQREGMPDMPIPREYPFSEGKMLFHRNPEAYVPPEKTELPGRAKILRRVEPGSKEDITGGKGFTLVERAYRSLRSPLEKELSTTVKKTAQELNVEMSRKEQLASEAIAAQMWKRVIGGGGRSIMRQTWELFAKGQSQRVKPDTKVYFTRCLMQWRLNPDEFAKKRPREANLLREIWASEAGE